MIPEHLCGLESRGTRTVRATTSIGSLQREAFRLRVAPFSNEIDHLPASLFIDYLSFLKRRGVMARWEDLKEKYPRQRRVLTVAPVTADPAGGDESR